MAVNYIKQLTLALMRFSDDERLNPSHVSLYLALFQFWNMNRFKNPISVNRSEVMRVSKIGSNATYHRCVKQLHEWEYLEYIPSYNPMRGSKVNMFIFETTGEQQLDRNNPKNEQVVKQVQVPSINNEKHIVNPSKRKGELHSPSSPPQKKRFIPPELQETKTFFQENKSTSQEAEKFYNHFESNGWKVGGKTPMKNWKAAARNWILRSDQFSGKKQNRLQTNENKDYDIPL